MSNIIGPLYPVGGEGTRSRVAFSRIEWRSLSGFYGFIVLLHAAGWGLYLHYAGSHPALVGLGFTAYLFGLRHAFDADHIAAIDDTVRYMLQKGRQPLGLGFYFALGHSTVVLALSVAAALAAATVKRELPQLQNIGGVIGTSVSGLFLCGIGILNFFVLLDILDLWRGAKSGTHSHAHLEGLLQKRGLLNRVFGRRLTRFMSHSWQMYPLGLLFGLGFDTASEVGLLAMTATASAGDLPLSAILSLPLLFAAGMTLMDTTDGVLMSKVYNWARINPLRKIFYNITTTGLSVMIALGIGAVELAQALTTVLDLHGGAYDVVAQWDVGRLGYVVVGIFFATWACSVVTWKVGRLEERYGGPASAHEHLHTHDGVTHGHAHIHEAHAFAPRRAVVTRRLT